MTPEILSTVAGAALMLIFAYAPGASTWFASLEGTRKRLIMLLMLVVVAFSSFGLACVGWLTLLFGLTLTCDQHGLAQMVYALILAIMANQGLYQLLPETQAVKRVKAQKSGLADLTLGRG